MTETASHKTSSRTTREYTDYIMHGTMDAEAAAGCLQGGVTPAREYGPGTRASRGDGPGHDRTADEEFRFHYGVPC